MRGARIDSDGLRGRMSASGFAFGAAWQYRVLTEPEDRLTFAEVPFDLSLAEIYEDIPVRGGNENKSSGARKR